MQKTGDHEPRKDPLPGGWAAVLNEPKSPSDSIVAHIEIMPRLLRTSGFEWGSGFYILPTSPEDAAKYLREV